MVVPSGPALELHNVVPCGDRKGQLLLCACKSIAGIGISLVLDLLALPLVVSDGALQTELLMKLYNYFRSGTSHWLRITLQLKGLAYAY